MLVKTVREKIRRNPHTTIQKMAQDHNVNRTTMTKIIKDDIGVKPYKIQYRHLMSKCAKKRDRSKVLLNCHAVDENVIMIYCDEKLFAIRRKFNKQYD
uniref:Uncharacterized protein n=1 Tax=Lepeophtheirus salmonis TaxID=72036 RepID=A0A0K2TP41_LEPSM